MCSDVFIYTYTCSVCLGTAKALAILRDFEGSPEPSLFESATSTKISCVRSFVE